MIRFHLRINGERCPIETPKRDGESPRFADGGEQCDDCGADADDLTYDKATNAFLCECGTVFKVLDGGFIGE